MTVRKSVRKIGSALLVGVFLIVDCLVRLVHRRYAARASYPGYEVTEFEASEPDTVTLEYRYQTDREHQTFVDGLEATRSESNTDTSRPLPTIEIHRPTADRGADVVREHLDGKRCIFCGVPVGDDEEFVETDKFGTLVTTSICKGHSEHPDSWLRARRHQPEKMGYCPSCGGVTTQDAYSKECSICDSVDLKTPNERRL